MLATKGNSSMAASIADAVPTAAEADSPIAAGADSSARDWDRIIDDQLIEWGLHPELLEDDDVAPSSRAVIQRAFELAYGLKQRGIAAPDAVVRDPNGGIVFERRHGDDVETIHIWDDGNVEYCRFHRTRLVERWAI